MTPTITKGGVNTTGTSTHITPWHSLITSKYPANRPGLVRPHQALVMSSNGITQGCLTKISGEHSHAVLFLQLGLTGALPEL